jgi:uncharacterized protein (TIGR02284 family)
MSSDTHDPTAAISQLTTDIADIIKGYEVMEGKAESELRPIAQRLHALHEAHAAELLTAIEDMGGRPEDSGSMMGAVHQAVATGRDWFDALDETAIPQIVSGEETLLSSYDATLELTIPRPEIHAVLLHQRSALQAQVDALKRR